MSLASPPSGAFLGSSPVTVTGTVGGSGPFTVSVNGVAATLTAEGFTATVPLTEGPNLLEAEVVSPFGTAADAVSVTLDTVPPVVTISAPEEGLQTNATTIEVSGTATDLTGVQSVFVNGQLASLDGETFTIALPLVDGDNVITAIATDTAGITGSATVTVFRADPPTITIDRIPGDTPVNVPALIVSGMVAGTDVTVFVNDVPAPLDEDGRYSSTVQLLEGANSVEARAESPFGTDVVVIDVVLDTAAPLAQIDEPVDGLSTSLDTILVRGSASDGSGISTVVVNGVVATLTGSSWSAEAPLAFGPNAITVTVTDLAGNTTSSTIHVNRELVPLSIDIGSPSDGFATSDATIGVSGFVSDSSATVLVNGVAANVVGSSFTAEIPLSLLTNVVTATAERGSDSAQDEIIVIRSTTSPPAPAPEPEELATSVDPTVATDIASSVAFLYEGPDPIQAASDPGVFEPKRLSVIRGRVLDRSGDGLPGVTVRILDRPEFGTTTTRADGGYDLAVNGGTTYLVDLRRPGSIPAQRRVRVAWREFAIVEDVVILPLDARATVVDFANPTEPVQIHRGSISSDADGSRQATVFFPAGVSASMRMPDGSSQPLSQGTVRLTEFTVGDLGPNAMPGALPPESGYTYAVDMCIDEAFVAGATGVDFSEPVPLYVDNFLGFPVGTPAPFGFYDFGLGQWVPSDDGVVLRIASIEGGLATVVPALPLSDDERAALAATYQVGDELWRVPVPHFSEGDINWPRGFPSDADNPPFGFLGFLGELTGEPGCSQGSIIECETQVLGESIPVVGTPFNLHYRSDRVPGRAAKRTVQIPITTDDPPASLKRVDVTVDVAGQRHELTFPPTPGQPTAEFTWDGKDAYGRGVSGSSLGRVRIGWVYDGSYQTPGAIGQSFGQPSETQIELVPSRREAIAVKELTARFGTVDARGWGVGGWTLSPHHFYDPDEKVLYRGDGNKRNTLGAGRVIERFAGQGVNLSTSGIPGPALDASFGGLSDVAVGPDGVVYLIQLNGGRMFSVDPETGMISNVSSPSTGASTGVGLPISNTRLEFPESMDIGPDGSSYVTVGLIPSRIRRIDPDGIVRAFAGVEPPTPSSGCDEVGNGEGELATEVVLCWIRDVTAAPDGSVYFADRVVGDGLAGSRIRRITPDGRLHTILGEGDGAVAGTPARRWTVSVISLAVDSEGTLYFTDGFRVYRVRSEDSIVELVAGGGDPANGLGDGLPATEVDLRGITDLEPSSDGGVYVATLRFSASVLPTGRIRHISPGGIIRTIAGNGESGIGGNGRVATRAPLARLDGLAEGPDGTVYVAELQNMFPSTSQVRAIRSFIPDCSDTEITIPSESGDELYDFDSNGRHLRTRHALTDAELLTFGYDDEGRLVEIREVAPSGDPADDLVTSILRDGSGTPIEIVGPYGAVTTLATDANGFLDAVSNPKSETHRMRYTSDGLLESFIRPAGGEFRFLYDAKGLLIRDDDPEGGFQTLARVDDDSGYSVTLRTGLGVTRVKRVEDGLAAGDGLQRRVRTDPAGLETEIVEIPGEMEIVREPSGLETETILGADPRLGLARPVVEERITRLPSGLVRTEASSRTVTLDPVSRELLTQEDVTTVNDRPTSILFDAVALTREIVTPEGRTLVQRLDAQGRTIGVRLGDLEELTFDYDDSGRLVETRQGQGLRERVTTWTRDAAGNIDTISALLDGTPLTSVLRYDAANQLESLTSPGLSTTEFGYDPNGNVSRLRPASQPDHGFEFSDLDLEERYTPPAVSIADPSSHRSYDLDRRPTELLRADGSSITQGYDAFGRLASITIPRGATTLAYSPTTGLLDRIDAPGGESLVFGYDGPLVTSIVSTGTVSGSVGFDYDPDLRIESERVNGASEALFGYDGDSLLVAAGDLAIERDPLTGLVASTTLGALVTTRQHDEFGALEAMATTASASGAIYSVAFERDTLGRIVRKLETIEGETTDVEYGYDLDGRLVSVRENGLLVRSYVYDPNGNRISATDPGGTVTGSYDVQDRLIQYGDAIYSHDEAGDLVSRQRAGEGLESFSYDALGNLVAVTRSDGAGGSGGAGETQIEYVIDGEGRRVGKKVGGVLVQGFLYRDALNPVAELDGSGSVVSRFVYGTRSNVPEYLVRGGATYRIVSDHLGSVRLVVNASTGAVAQRIDYDEWGVVTLDTNPGFQPFGFAGGLYDSDTGLVRFGARDYDPEVGRWTTKDPIRFEGGDGNLYGYVLNDPVNLSDPYGLTPLLRRIVEQVAKKLGKSGAVESAMAEAFERERDRKLAEIGPVTDPDRERAIRDEFEIRMEGLEDLKNQPAIPRFRSDLSIHLEQLETALGVDLDGDGAIGPRLVDPNAGPICR